MRAAVTVLGRHTQARSHSLAIGARFVSSCPPTPSSSSEQRHGVHRRDIGRRASMASATSDSAAATVAATHWDGVFGRGATNHDKVGFYQEVPESSLRLLDESGVLRQPAPAAAAAAGADARQPITIVEAGGGTAVFVDRILERAREAGPGVEEALQLHVADLSGEACAAMAQRLHETGLVEKALVPDAAAESSKRWSGEHITLLVGDLTDDKAVPLPANVDLWHDRAVLHFLTDDAALNKYADRIRDSVRADGGYVAIEAFDLDNAGRESCAGLPVRRHSPTTLAALLGADFKLITSWSTIHRTPGGYTQPYMHALFKRGADREEEPTTS